MADLDTCFFCARTGDVRLDEYDVVPEAVDPSTAEQRTVMLCGTCSSKLDLVLETVLGAVGELESTPTAAESETLDLQADTSGRSELGSEQPEMESAGDGGTESGRTSPLDGPGNEADQGRSGPDVAEAEPEPIFGESGDESATSDGGTSTDPRQPQEGTLGGTGEEPHDTEGAERHSIQEGETEPERSVGESEPDPANRGETVEKGNTERSETAATGGDHPDGTADQSTATQSTDADSAEGGLEGIRFAEQPDGSQTGKTGDQIDLEADQDATAGDSEEFSGDSAGSTSETGDTGTSGPESTDDSRDASDVDIDVKTYKRVIRLLRNRDLPIDRTEFESLAASAYDIDQTECAAALDAAIERDLLVEESGQLDRA
jgi:hypothetical protein